jgi:hypothetical protein
MRRESFILLQGIIIGVSLLSFLFCLSLSFQHFFNVGIKSPEQFAIVFTAIGIIGLIITYLIEGQEKVWING